MSKKLDGQCGGGPDQIMPSEATEQTKACTTCGKVKPLTDFYRDRRIRSGYFTECKVCIRLRNVAWVKANPERNYDHQKSWHKKNGDVVQCWGVIAYAIRQGRITKKPCVKCGTVNDIHAHHENYNEPHNITWLCRKHHVELHNRVRNRRADPKSILYGPSVNKRLSW